MALLDSWGLPVTHRIREFMYSYFGSLTTHLQICLLESNVLAHSVGTNAGGQRQGQTFCRISPGQWLRSFDSSSGGIAGGTRYFSLVEESQTPESENTFRVTGAAIT